MKQEQIKEINQHISDALEQWQDIMLTADADQWAYELNYSKTDVLNVIYMFNHVLTNVGVKNGTINVDRSKRIADSTNKLVEYMTGYDINELIVEKFNK